MKEFDDIDKLFASGFDDFQVSPPENVKINIDKELFYSNVSETPKKSGRNRWFLLLIPIAMLAAYFIAINTNSPQKSESKTRIQKENTLNHQTSSTQASKNSQAYTTTSKNSMTQKENSATSSINHQSTEKVTQPKMETFYSTHSNSNTSAKNGNNGSSSSQVNTNQSTIVTTEKDKQNASTSISNSGTNEANAASNAHSATSSVVANTAEKETGNSVKTEVDSLKKELSKDSVSSAKTSDSVKNQLGKEKQKKSAESKWQLGVYTGILSGFTTISNAAFSAKESLNVDFSAEASYAINKKLALSSGLAYNGRKQDWTQTSTISDSIITSYNFVIVIDSLGVPDTLYIPVYGLHDSIIFTNTTLTSNVFSVPISLNYLLFEKNNWSGSIGAGLRLSYYKISQTVPIGTMESPSLSAFGLQGFIRPELNYSINNWSLGLYGRFASDFKEPVRWSFKQSHFAYGAGLVLKYKF